jgi:hypothetical protein
MISDEDIEEIVGLFIEVANATDALDEVMKDYQDRSLGIKIWDSRYNTGLILQNGRLRALKTLDRPTCVVTIDKNTFWKVLNLDKRAVEQPGDKDLPPDKRQQVIHNRLAELRRLTIYTAFFTERTIDLSSEDGDIQIHSENLIKIFSKIAEVTS